MRRVLYANFTSPASTPLLIDNFKKNGLSLESWKAACWRSRSSALATPKGWQHQKQKGLSFEWSQNSIPNTSVYAQDTGGINCPSHNMTEKQVCVVIQCFSNLALSHESASSIWISPFEFVLWLKSQSSCCTVKSFPQKTPSPRIHKRNSVEIQTWVQLFIGFLKLQSLPPDENFLSWKKFIYIIYI